MGSQLIYIHDPMCSWCYAFVPVLDKLRSKLAEDIEFRRLLGGLAPTSDQPMPLEMRERLMESWRRIESSVPGTRFNHEFWSRCIPRRSTWPACHAVIAARSLNASADERMTKAIQHAYYRQARNPSDHSTLIELASEIRLDADRFANRLNAPGTHAELEREMAEAAALGVDSYPALILMHGQSRWPIAIDYNHPEPMLETIEQLLSF